MRPETIAIHSGFDCDPATKAVAVPIYQTVAYAFDSADHGAALFNLEEEGFRYSRIANPTVAILEERVAALEGGVAGLATASGQAALYYAFSNIADSFSRSGGATIVSTPQLYGTTHTLLAHLLPRAGISTRFAAADTAEAMAAAIDENTKALFCVTVVNPAGNICDIEAIAKVAHAHGVPLIVDNTVSSTILLKPIDYGADIVAHSLTKFMGGHGSAMGGILVDGGNFDWKAQGARFPQFTTPDDSYHGLVYADRFGRAAFLARARSVYQRTTGAVLSPMSAFLLLQGIETVALRVERHVDNARAVAQFLAGDARVEWVQYASFEQSPYHALAQQYLGGRVPSLLTFGVKGGFAAGKDLYDALGLIKRLVNIGDAKSLACHPASTTHRQMSEAEQKKAGVTPATIRLSVGIEHIDDIIADLDQALAAAMPGRLRAVRWMAGVEKFTLGGGRDYRGAVHVGLVNNMPDAAMRATELQFAKLLKEASGPLDVRLHLFSLPEIPRGEVSASRMEGFYADAETLPTAGVDALIVTGAEPRASDLREEPYWNALSHLVDWAEIGTISTLFSCLAAHAAVQHLDNIERQPLDQKLSGVFLTERAGDDPLLSGLPAQHQVPHSRRNTLPEAALTARGYRILSRIPGHGVDLFTRHSRSLFVFAQGHPEYGAERSGPRISARHGAFPARRRRAAGGPRELFRSPDRRPHQ